MYRMIACLLLLLILVVGGVLLTDRALAQTWGVGHSAVFARQETANGLNLTLFDGAWSIPVTLTLAEIEHEDGALTLRRGGWILHLPLMVSWPQGALHAGTLGH